VAQAALPTVYNTRSFTLACDGSKARLSSTSSDSFNAGITWEDHFMLLMMIDLVRMFAGSNWRPEDVALEAGDFEGRRECAVLASSTVHQGEDATMVEFPRTLLDRPWVESALRVPEFRCPKKELDSDTLPRDLATSLQSVLELLVPQNITDINSAALVMGTSRRTLQRHLAGSGHTFSSLLQRARLTVASRRLTDPSVKLIDIAFEIGYTDPSQFSKAFRRWTGASPREYRRRLTHPFGQLSNRGLGSRHVGAALPGVRGGNVRHAGG
jgi:AraC-like DNA-binding protein